MNFLIFLEFFWIFLNLFRLLKKSLYRALMWQLMWRRNDVSLCDGVYMHYVVHVCVCMCMCVHVYARKYVQSVISGLSIHKGFLLTHYIHFMMDIMWLISQSHFYVSFLCSLKWNLFINLFIAIHVWCLQWSLWAYAVTKWIMMRWQYSDH